MNDIEAMKHLEKMIERKTVSGDPFYLTQLAIENLINKVKELEEIEEEHRKENGKLQEKIKKIKENYNKLFNGYCERVSEIINLEDECESKEKSYNDCYCEYKHYKQFESIPKSKIKEKIEELRKIHEVRDYTNKEAFYLDCYKELLEEQEDK